MWYTWLSPSAQYLSISLSPLHYLPSVLSVLEALWGQTHTLFILILSDCHSFYM